VVTTLSRARFTIFRLAKMASKWLIALGGFLGLSVASGTAVAASPTLRVGYLGIGRDQYDELFKQYAMIEGVKDWRWLKAIAMVESAMNPQAINDSEPGGASIGLMQIYIRGYPKGPTNSLPGLEAVGLWPVDPQKLFDPEENIKRGAAILGSNQRAYGEIRGVATYNAWNAHNAPPYGPFPNQGYVDKVKGWYDTFRQQ
jgi:soluble lytic murein transglycosylase-like protein